MSVKIKGCVNVGHTLEIEYVSVDEHEGDEDWTNKILRNIKI